MSKENLSQLIEEYGSLLQKYKVKKWAATIFPWRYSDPLVQPELEHIMALADKHKIKVMLTTNAVSFNKKQCDIIEKYKHLIETIHVSVIGFTAEQVWQWMKIKKEKTLMSLKFVRDNYPNISKKLRVAIKHKSLHMAPDQLIAEYQELVLGDVKGKFFRPTNRLGDGDGDWTKPYDGKPVDKENYVVGCKMKGGRIMRQMEILVNGQVVLCCDDADGKTNYGNVFKDGIEETWKNIQNEHTLIFEKTFSEDKKNLICNSCTRGVFSHANGKNAGSFSALEEYFQKVQKETAIRVGL
jgi:MoaA/NifB/PqqE/SkfB family radical SAM enzyme